MSTDPSLYAKDDYAAHQEGDVEQLLLVDPERLDELLRYRGFRECVAFEVIGIFLEVASDRVDAVCLAATQANKQELSRSALALRGLANSVGATRLARAAAVIEDGANGSGEIGWRHMIAHLSPWLGQTSDALTMYRATACPPR